ncbi:MAG: AGE family epimerase/isomerase [Candidatus Pseudobacter hemicellulosilyticus]|uniref:AGE family epimerase/isomerase n=1 Tax=Candidatus Pseudobacter hemicellulosilyticus TaxID=3121375 RepID=A0AAJ6BFG7_9BACT|nr:MAG: AGE family epimerase/isomerase [Pseudobacter sp.]
MRVNETELAPGADLTLEPANWYQPYGQLYKDELLNNILPFWLKHSLDETHGGFFTCLNRDGSIYDTDKFMWLQGRQVWCFSYMYRHLQHKKEWLDMAMSGAAFMQQHGRDAKGNWYFALNKEGRPLVQPYNIFSDCFATMAFASMDKVLPGKGYGAIAIDTFDNILRRAANTKGDYNKLYPGTRPLKSLSLPMILSNLVLEMEHLLEPARVNEHLEKTVHEVMNVFYQPELGMLVENVAPDGSLVDCFDGRVLNPGHVIETMWFVMDIGKRLGNEELIRQCCNIALNTLEYGWDKEFGGIFYFMDRKGAPPQQLEWDQKLWWVHVETLVALAKGYQLTGDERCAHWFKKVHDYTWQHFRDPEFGEWYGYLNRRGEVLLPLKGGKWKGCFHVPRGLFQVAKTFGQIPQL